MLLRARNRSQSSNNLRRVAIGWLNTNKIDILLKYKIWMLCLLKIYGIEHKSVAILMKSMKIHHILDKQQLLYYYWVIMDSQMINCRKNIIRVT